MRAWRVRPMVMLPCLETKLGLLTFKRETMFARVPLPILGCFWIVIYMHLIPRLGRMYCSCRCFQSASPPLLVNQQEPGSSMSRFSLYVWTVYSSSFQKKCTPDLRNIVKTTLRSFGSLDLRLSQEIWPSRRRSCTMCRPVDAFALMKWAVVAAFSADSWWSTKRSSLACCNNWRKPTRPRAPWCACQDGQDEQQVTRGTQAVPSICRSSG